MNKDKTKKKTWASIGKVNIGSGWTLLSVECYLTSTCKNCVYKRYCCKNLIGVQPILKVVIKQLEIKFGKPPENMINKILNIDEDVW